jgi:hypothetical protein
MIRYTKERIIRFINSDGVHIYPGFTMWALSTEYESKYSSIRLYLECNNSAEYFIKINGVLKVELQKEWILVYIDRKAL